MKLLSQLLTIYNWGVICVLLLFLVGIARFFERRLFEKTAVKKRRYYPFFIVPIAFFLTSALLYVLSEDLIVGNLLADTLRIIGGITFAFIGYALLKTMMGGRS